MFACVVIGLTTIAPPAATAALWVGVGYAAAALASGIILDLAYGWEPLHSVGLQWISVDLAFVAVFLSTPVCVRARARAPVAAPLASRVRPHRRGPCRYVIMTATSLGTAIGAAAAAAAAAVTSSAAFANAQLAVSDLSRLGGATDASWAVPLCGAALIALATAHDIARTGSCVGWAPVAADVLWRGSPRAPRAALTLNGGPYGQVRCMFVCVRGWWWWWGSPTSSSPR